MFIWNFISHSDRRKQFAHETQLRILCEKYNIYAEELKTKKNSQQKQSVLVQILLTLLTFAIVFLVFLNYVKPYVLLIYAIILLLLYLGSRFTSQYTTRSVTNRLIKCIDKTEKEVEEIVNLFNAKVANKMLENVHIPISEGERQVYFQHLRESAYRYSRTS